MEKNPEKNGRPQKQTNGTRTQKTQKTQKTQRTQKAPKKKETIEEQFTRELLEQLKKAEAETGVSETRLALQAQEHGGVEAVKQLLRRGQTTRQFEPLQRAGRLKYSMEALVTKGKYAALFTDDEVNQCLTALLSGGMY